MVGTQTIRPGIPIRNLCLFLDVEIVDSCFAEQRQPLPAALKRAVTHPGREPFYLRGRATSAMGLAVRQMLTCSLRGGLARLYLEAKVLEIAALRLAQLTEDDAATPKLRLTRRDVDQLDYARHILCARHHDPPTISELARAVGLNRTKLKAGFKRQFGSTIYGFVRSQRMQHAVTLLREGEYNVSEAAAMMARNRLILLPYRPDRKQERIGRTAEWPGRRMVQGRLWSQRGLTSRMPENRWKLVLRSAPDQRLTRNHNNLSFSTV
ncbi:MAG: AraC family transcriptional regulator [Spirochaetaceae bacterium]|nr:MAG: AraC family transcriptional regulator [Spirochaetaceae bacterium]